MLESRAIDLEKHANELLETVFRDSVCSEEVLRLQVFVEDAYESCVGPNEANLDSFSMMKWIEKIHDELNLKLDTLPPEVVKACEKEGFKQELKVMKQTEEAAKKVIFLLFAYPADIPTISPKIFLSFFSLIAIFEQSLKESLTKRKLSHFIRYSSSLCNDCWSL